MRTPLVVTVVMLLVSLSVVRPARAQTWSDRARVSLNVGVQQASTTFSATTHVPVYSGASTLTTGYTVPTGAFFDGGVILRASGSLGIEVGVSSYRKSEAAPVSGTIPHPIVGNAARAIAGTSGPLERSEIIGRIDAAYVLSAGWIDLAVSAGPSFFTVNQDLVANVTFTESPSFDRVAFTGATVTSAGATKLGFNAGVDVSVKLSKNVGIGGVLRYSHASVTFPLENTTSGVTADAGGMHVGGGLRVYF